MSDKGKVTQLIMKRTRTITLGLSSILLLLALLMTETARADPSPWVSVEPGEKIYGMSDVPLQALQQDTDSYVGTVFEGQFKFYRIYHDKQDADPARRGQVIVGETHFTARPVNQPLDMIQVELTPPQEAWIRERGIARPDAIRLRLRFKGIAPGSALAFELLEVIEASGPGRNS